MSGGKDDALENEAAAVAAVHSLVARFFGRVPSGFRHVTEYRELAFVRSEQKAQPTVFREASGMQQQRTEPDGGPCICPDPATVLGVLEKHTTRIRVRLLTDVYPCSVAPWEGWVEEREVEVRAAPMFHPAALEAVLTAGLHRKTPLYACVMGSRGKDQKAPYAVKPPTLSNKHQDRKMQFPPVSPAVSLPGPGEPRVHFDFPKNAEGVCFSQPLPFCPEEPEEGWVGLWVDGVPRSVHSGPSHAHPVVGLVLPGETFDACRQVVFGDSHSLLPWARVRTSTWVTPSDHSLAGTGELRGFVLLVDLNSSLLPLAEQVFPAKKRVKKEAVDDSENIDISWHTGQ